MVMLMKIIYIIKLLDDDGLYDVENNPLETSIEWLESSIICDCDYHSLYPKIEINPIMEDTLYAIVVEVENVLINTGNGYEGVFSMIENSIKSVSEIVSKIVYEV